MDITLVELVTMLTEGAGIGAGLAFLFERFQWFQKMSSDVKFWFVLAVQLGVPLLAMIALRNVPPEIWAEAEPYFHVVATCFIGWASGQAAHKWQKAQAREG